jgi:hypothetical protein
VRDDPTHEELRDAEALRLLREYAGALAAVRKLTGTGAELSAGEKPIPVIWTKESFEEWPRAVAREEAARQAWHAFLSDPEWWQD